MVVGDHSYVTGHSNDTVLQKYGISDPLLQGKGPEQHLPFFFPAPFCHCKLKRVQVPVPTAAYAASHASRTGREAAGLRSLLPASVCQELVQRPSSEAVLHRWNRLLRGPPEPSPEQSQLLHRRAAPEPVTCPICLMTFQDHATLKFHHTKVHETRTKEEQQVHKQVMRTRTEAHLKYPKVLCGRHADVSHVWKLQLFRQDSAYVLFMKTSAPLAILPQLFNLIQAWNAKKAKDPASPGLPLRVVLLGGLLQQIEQRIKQLDTDESLRRQSKEDKLLSEADCFNYLEYQRRRATRFRRGSSRFPEPMPWK